jgi:hypothetical protein
MQVIILLFMGTNIRRYRITKQNFLEAPNEWMEEFRNRDKSER